jgi:hypothetical protein
MLAGVMWLMHWTAAQGQDNTAINLARCMRSETDSYSGHNNTEWAAMSWVLYKRAFQKGVTFNTMILQYCAVFRRCSIRANAIRASTFAKPKHGTKKQWAKLKRFTTKFMNGLYPDPCSHADHFGNESDVKGKALVEVCPWLGERGNKFYRVKR